MNKNHPLMICALAGTCLLPTRIALPGEQPFDLSAYAGDTQACILIHETATGRQWTHNAEQCNERLSPCSTFKVPNALIGLETGVLSGPGDRKTWDGTVHSRKVQNRDHDLSSAIRHSVVWYFQAVALDIGPQRMQEWLDALDYGNRDISGGQDRFWLSSSLEITALEQLRFMAALAAGTLPAAGAKQAAVRHMIRQDQHLPDGFRGELHGKTGSCPGQEADHGWFTGFYRRDGAEYVFTVNVKGKDQWGWQAREVAVEALRDLP